jgi:hypothetical protein
LHHGIFSVQRERSQHNIKRASSDRADARFVVGATRAVQQRRTARSLHSRNGRMLAHNLHRATEVRARARLRHAAAGVRGGRHERLGLAALRHTTGGKGATKG